MAPQATSRDKRTEYVLFATSKTPSKKEIREIPCLKRLPMLYYKHSPLRGIDPFEDTESNLSSSEQLHS
jgi:hypothetical protein